MAEQLSTSDLITLRSYILCYMDENKEDNLTHAHVIKARIEEVIASSKAMDLAKKEAD